MTPDPVHALIDNLRTELNGSITALRSELVASTSARDAKLEEQKNGMHAQDLVLADILGNVRNTNGKVAENIRTIELQRIESAAIAKRLDDHKAAVALKEATEKAAIEAKLEKEKTLLEAKLAEERAKAKSDRRVVYAIASLVIGAVTAAWAVYPDQLRAALTPQSKEERIRVVDDRIQQWFPTQPSPKPTRP